jgi:methylated-DNA-protein-cysteine methyltransferase-like protein
MTHSGGYIRIYNLVRRIPRGRVATYGQIATLAGIPGHARQIGYAMAALPEDSRVPWHRVVNARGMISPRADRGYEPTQQVLLEAEGVQFDAGGRLNLERHRWRPRRPST